MPKIIGTLSVLELDTLSKHYGRDFLPYPFRFTRSIPYESADDVRVFRASVLDGFKSGKFDHLRRWLDVQLRDADLRIECMYVYADGKPSVDVSATRWNDIGYIARQDDHDVIFFKQKTAYDIGPEVVKLVDMTGRPGALGTITVPSIGITAPVSSRPREDDSDVPIKANVFSTSEPAHKLVPYTDLLAGGEIYTAWRPARQWGRDRVKGPIGWIATRHGDYMVEQPHEYATPVTRQQLLEKVNRSISKEIADLKSQRSE